MTLGCSTLSKCRSVRQLSTAIERPEPKYCFAINVEWKHQSSTKETVFDQNSFSILAPLHKGWQECPLTIFLLFVSSIAKLSERSPLTFEISS